MNEIHENVFKFGTNKLVTSSLFIFYFCGMWPKETSTILYSIVGYTFQGCTSLAWTIAKCIGTFMLEDKSEIIEFTATSIYAVMSTCRGFTIMMNSKTICNSLNAISEFKLNKEENDIIIKKVNNFTKTSSAYAIFICLGLTSALLNPVVSDKRVMPVPIWLPCIDWKENDRNFYFGIVFSVMGILSIVVFCAVTPIIVWYLLFASSLMLEVLGQRLRGIRYQNNEYGEEKCLDNLVKCIRLHQQIIDNVKKIEDSFSIVFLLQITSSAVCICSVAYLMASEPLSENINKLGMYISLGGIYGYEIFVLIYYGNEIALASDRLSYYIYESNWIYMSIQCKKIIIINVEKWKKPHEIVVGKVFLMRIKILTSILNVAYSIFNVLRKN